MNHKQNDNIFINSGIRSKYNSDLLNSKDLIRLGCALGIILSQDFDEPCNILIATDTRPSGENIKEALIEGITTCGHDVFDAVIAATPMVAKAMKDYTYSYQREESPVKYGQHQEDRDDDDDDEENDDAQVFMLGIVITASHNPPEYNGIKIFTQFGYLNVEMEEAISEIFHMIHTQPDIIQTIQANQEPGDCIDFDVATFYQDEVLDQLTHAPYQNMTIVLDCAHGATSYIAERIFKACNFSTISINNSHDGSRINQHSGCHNPTLLLDAIKQHNASWGCAFDGDGDRVILINKEGEIFNGDDIAAVITQHPNYQKNNMIVGTIMTNGGLEDFLTEQRKKLIRTPVGERNIIDALMKHQAFIGCETCGHITLMNHAFCSDGIFAALMFFDTLATSKNINLHPYNKHHQLHATISLENKRISSNNIVKIIDQLSQANQRIIIRPSNTEPILRIMVESENEIQAQKTLDALKEKCQKEINGL